jgi:RNA polymerase primary sigma factor
MTMSEHDLVAACKQGDPAARDALIEAHLAAVGGVARRYRGVARVDHAELMQEGVVGLLRAIGRYDLERETPFWAYASWWVRQAMQQLVAELGRPVVLSDRALRDLAQMHEAQRAHRQARGGEPSRLELARRTGFSDTHVNELMAVDSAPRTLDEPMSADDGSSTTFGETLADEQAEDAFDRVVVELDSRTLRTLPDELCERERMVVRKRYGFDGRAHTLREIGSELDISAERVRQIEQGALEKLREAAVGTV